MKKMLQIISSALFISFITFPSNAIAQSYSDNQDGIFSTPVIIVAVISTLLLAGFTLSLLDLRKDMKKV